MNLEHPLTAAGFAGEEPAAAGTVAPLTAAGSPGAAVLVRRALGIATTSCRYLIPGALVACKLALFQGRPAAQRHLARRLVALLQRLGPAFIKGGQILGTRRDVLPRILCDELSALHDSVAPVSPAEARSALSAVYGASLGAVFAHIDDRPLASGSIACVYRGRLHDGREVAVKLQRPAIREVMSADLTLAARAGALAARLPPLRGVPVSEVLDYLCGAVHAQLDFVREAASLRRLRENLSSVPRVWVPRVEQDASRDLAVVMELIPGLDTALAESCSAAERRRFAAGTLTAMYRMLFVDGFVHCDLHPGNLYFTERGQVVILDAGFSVQLTDRMRRLFAEFFLEMSLGRGRRCAEVVIASSTGKRPDADLEGFTLCLADLVERSSGLPAREFSLIAFATELFQLQRRFGLHAAPELLFPLLSLLVIEGTIRDLDPDVDFQEAARPVLTRGVFGIGHGNR